MSLGKGVVLLPEIFYGGFFMPEGTVKWFNDKKGYGFIVGEDGSDLFVHYSEIETNGFKTLEKDQRVSYELEEGPKGPKAVHVRPA